MKQDIPFIPVLAALIKNENGEFLIAKRKSDLSNGGKWEFPGGKLRFSETPEECLKREIKEELGIDIIVLNPFQIVNQSLYNKSILLIAYLCSYEGGELRLKDHDLVKWINPNLLMEHELSEPDRPISLKLAEVNTSPGQMIPIEIEKSLQGTIKIGALFFDGLDCQSKNDRLWEEIEQLGKSYQQEYSEPSQALEVLQSARDLYRKIGIEPTKTRPSSEALLRRAIKGKLLYRVNSIVDVGNLCSLKFLLPIGLYDLTKINEFIVLRRGQKGEEYQGIGKEMIHVEGRYTLADKKGAFGNPSSDSLRTSINVSTKNLLLVIFAPFHYPDDRLQTHIDFSEQKMLQFHRGILFSKEIRK